MSNTFGFCFASLGEVGQRPSVEGEPELKSQVIWWNPSIALRDTTGTFVFRAASRWVHSLIWSFTCLFVHLLNLFSRMKFKISLWKTQYFQEKSISPGENSISVHAKPNLSQKKLNFSRKEFYFSRKRLRSSYYMTSFYFFRIWFSRAFLARRNCTKTRKCGWGPSQLGDCVENPIRRSAAVSVSHQSTGCAER